MSDLIGQLTQTLGRTAIADTSGAAWADGSWWQQLVPGSWRGVGFVMDAAELRTGRRTAVHEYPYRDTVWVEDLGRLPRRFAFQAFIVGDDVYDRRNAMIEACEQPGEGTLVHPTLGTLQCVLVDFTTTDRRERGRMVELAFSFVVSGEVQFPATVMATGANVLACAGALNGAATADLVQYLGANRVPSLATRNLGGFAGMATSMVDDPVRALNSVRGLQGYFGRYGTGSRTTMLPPTATVASCLSDAVASRGAVFSAADGLGAALRGL